MGKLSKELRMGIHNRFDIEVVDVETGKVKQRAQAFNVVCDSYFSRILSDDVAEEIQIGSGTGTPAKTDTALFSYVGYASRDSTYSPSDTIDTSHEYEGVWVRTIKRAIPNSSYVGATITELGLAYSQSGNAIVTHAMLQDMNGNPISIQHTSTDIINVYCNIYLHYDGQDGDVHLFTGWNTYYYNSANKRAIVNRALLQNLRYTTGRDDCTVVAQWGHIQRYYVPEGLVQSSDFASVNTSTRNGALVLTANQIPISSANMKGLGLLTVGNYGTYYARGKVEEAIDAGRSVFPPTTITNESVGVGDGSTTKFKTAFSYPINATVKINGVVQNSGVSILYAPSGISWGGGSSGEIGYDSNNLHFCYHMTPVYSENVTIRKYPQRDASNMTHIENGETVEMAHPSIGIYGIYQNSGSTKVIQGSDDGETWVDVPITTNMYGTQMDQTKAHFRYYRNNSGRQMRSIYLNAYDGYNIIFDNPPAQGDIITIDYTTDYIPKDSDHVLDVELTFTFGEWTGE